MDATQILNNLAEKYALCRSYCDEGEVEFDDVKGQIEHLQFKTRFERPDYFSFEWQDYGPRRGKSEGFSVLWSLKEETRTRYRWGVETKENLPSAIAGATGCSAGAADIVPALLIERLREQTQTLLRLTELEFLRDENCNGIDCHLLQGSLFKSGDHHLWISKQDSALIRLRLDQSSSAEEMRRDIEALLANTDLMAQLSEKGIAPPTKVEYKANRFVTQYTYNDIRFDELVTRLPDPEEVLSSGN